MRYRLYEFMDDTWVISCERFELPTRMVYMANYMAEFTDYGYYTEMKNRYDIPKQKERGNIHTFLRVKQLEKLYVFPHQFGNFLHIGNNFQQMVDDLVELPYHTDMHYQDLEILVEEHYEVQRIVRSSWENHASYPRRQR